MTRTAILGTDNARGFRQNPHGDWGWYQWRSTVTPEPVPQSRSRFSTASDPASAAPYECSARSAAVLRRSQFACALQHRSILFGT